MPKYYFNQLKLLAKKTMLPHAILLLGEEQVFEEAHNFIKWYLCDNFNLSKNIANCSCNSCSMVMANNHPDYCLINLDKTKPIKIDVIREANNFVNSVPYFSNKKILLLNNFNKINQDAANAFLKNLEEPLDSVLFLLISNNFKVLPSTILSRVLQIKMPLNNNNNYDNLEVLTDLHNIWVHNQESNKILEKWCKIDKQQLIFCLWSIVTNVIKFPKDLMLLQIRQKVSLDLLWKLLDSLNYINRSIILGESINWSLFLDNFVFTKYTGENIYGG
jgi:DNA polymerase III delta prime subunit